uniref:Glycosyltransferase n=1 Tax=Oryza punctata TaxID=4537 RepID=A0A0E0LI95_ORYPU
MEAAKPRRRRRRLHVVVFPWLAFGHLIPFLELAKRLAARGHAAVTFVSTPRNVSHLRGRGGHGGAALPAEVSDHLRLVSLPLPRVDGLPEGAESTADVPQEKVALLKAAFDGLAAPFAAFLADACNSGAEAAGDDEAAAAAGFGRKPDWIIVDFCHWWVPHIADEHEAKSVAAAFQPNSSGVSDADGAMELQRRCPVTFYRSCPEVEAQACRILDSVASRRFMPTGLLAPTAGPDGGDDDASAADLMRWLDEQPERSVVYLALGTEAPLTSANVRELARGLELSRQRFLWALGVPTAAARTLELLPEGFERRVAGRGVVRRGGWVPQPRVLAVVATGWVPQVRVLAHAAVGAFLTHCGWGSTVESLRFGGLPLVMLPFVGDQGIVAQAMAEKGIGAEVARDYDDGSFRGEDVAAAVRRVMVGEEGKVFVRKAKELRDAVSDEARQEHYIDEIAKYLRGYKYSGGN